MVAQLRHQTGPRQHADRAFFGDIDHDRITRLSVHDERHHTVVARRSPTHHAVIAADIHLVTFARGCDTAAFRTRSGGFSRGVPDLGSAWIQAVPAMPASATTSSQAVMTRSTEMAAMQSR